MLLVQEEAKGIHLLLEGMTTKAKILAMEEILIEAICSLSAQMTKSSAIKIVNPT